MVLTLMIIHHSDGKNMRKAKTATLSCIDAVDETRRDFKALSWKTQESGKTSRNSWQIVTNEAESCQLLQWSDVIASISMDQLEASKSNTILIRMTGGFDCDEGCLVPVKLKAKREQGSPEVIHTWVNYIWYPPNRRWKVPPRPRGASDKRLKLDSQSSYTSRSDQTRSNAV